MRVLPTRWRQKSTGIDVEQNDVTVTVCIVNLVRPTTVQFMTLKLIKH